jgi:hypothetical protein
MVTTSVVLRSETLGISIPLLLDEISSWALGFGVVVPMPTFCAATILVMPINTVMERMIFFIYFFVFF